MKIMDQKEIYIRKALKEDARKIAEAIIMAIGEDHAMGMANGHDLETVIGVFKTLAESKDAQYSYTNALVAETESGETAGIVLAYDGKILIEARRLFFRLAKERFGWDIFDLVPDGEPPVETDPTEYYLDTLAVWPEYRHRGIATRLIKAVEEKAGNAGKPVGLLCAKDNERAHALYSQLGFREIGERPFAGEMMRHMQKL